MKRDVVNVRAVTGERMHESAIRGVPNLDELIIAASGKARAIGIDDQRANPAGMRLDRADRLRILDCRCRLPAKPAVIPAAIERLPVRGETDCPDPTIVPAKLQRLAI